MYEKRSGLPARVEVVLRLGERQLEVVQVEVVVVVAAAGGSDDLCRPGLTCFCISSCMYVGHGSSLLPHDQWYWL